MPKKERKREIEKEIERGGRKREKVKEWERYRGKLWEGGWKTERIIK